MNSCCFRCLKIKHELCYCVIYIIISVFCCWIFEDSNFWKHVSFCKFEHICFCLKHALMSFFLKIWNCEISNNYYCFWIVECLIFWENMFFVCFLNIWKLKKHMHLWNVDILKNEHVLFVFNVFGLFRFEISHVWMQIWNFNILCLLFFLVMGGGGIWNKKHEIKKTWHINEHSKMWCVCVPILRLWNFEILKNWNVEILKL